MSTPHNAGLRGTRRKFLWTNFVVLTPPLFLDVVLSPSVMCQWLNSRGLSMSEDSEYCIVHTHSIRDPYFAVCHRSP